jgi:hypothetical protein
MTQPASPPDGKFVTAGDVTARFEGNFPSNRVTWLKWRIIDVESELMNQVPSIANLDVLTDPDPAFYPTTAEGRRVRAVRGLVIDKVLEIFRNPNKYQSHTSTFDGQSSSYTLSGSKDESNAGVEFTAAELNRVRVKKKRRSSIGNYGVTPFGVPC